jgi:uncharacterized metal-binding protein YceD (DUF177 family)
MTDDQPFSYDYDLGDLGRGGAEVDVVAHGEELSRIAHWAGVSAVERFAATVALRRQSATRFTLDAELAADVVQECVVTLEPVKSRIERHVHRELHLAEHVHAKPNETVPLGAGAGDDEVPEEIESLGYDLAAPLLEDFALAIDPYPRAAGAEFSAPREPEARPENPFAVLKSLKNPS